MSVPGSTGRRIARITLEVEVHVDTDRGIDTPDVRELPYDYLAVHAVNVAAIELSGDSSALEDLARSGLDDVDPDELLRSAIAKALTAPAH